MLPWSRRQTTWTLGPGMGNRDPTFYRRPSQISSAGTPETSYLGDRWSITQPNILGRGHLNHYLWVLLVLPLILLRRVKPFKCSVKGEVLSIPTPPSVILPYGSPSWKHVRPS